MSESKIHDLGLIDAPSSYPQPRDDETQLEQSQALARAEAFRKLLGPLVGELLRGPDGGLDLAKVPAKDFKEFRKFLADQAGLNAAVRVGFLTIDSAPYQRLFLEERFLPLFKLLYRQIQAQEFVSLPDSEAEALLQEFQKELIAIDAKAFVQSKLFSPEGRKDLSSLLADPRELSDELRADLIRGVTYIMKDRGQLSDLEYYQVSQLSALGPLQALDFFNLFDSKAGLDPATRGALSLIDSAAFFEREAEAKRKAFQSSPERKATLTIEGKFQAIDPREVECFEKLAAEKSSQPDLASRAQGELARLWLMAADRQPWDADLLGTAEADRMRLHVMKGAEAYLNRAAKLETRKEFELFARDLRAFLEAEVDPERAGLDSPLQNLIQKLPSDRRASFDTLKHLADTWIHSIEMGEWIAVGPSSMKMGDEELRQKTALMIQGLEQTKHELWYGYKQHKLASRIGSEVADWFGGGDREDIRRANQAINQLIHRLREAESQKDLEAIAGQLFDSLKEGGALFKGLKASRMDFNEQLIGLGQTIAIMAALGLATRGLSLLGQGGAALLRSAGVLRGAAAAETALATTVTTVETATMAERVVNGFNLGTQISLAENAVALASGEVRQGPETAAGWAKDALATGTSMAFTGMLPISHAATANPLKNVWARYTAGTVQGAKFLAMDTAVEAFEEGIDDLARRAMDGDFMAIDPTQARNILALTLAGGGAKVGTAAEIIRGKTPETNLETRQESKLTSDLASKDPLRREYADRIVKLLGENVPRGEESGGILLAGVASLAASDTFTTLFASLGKRFKEILLAPLWMFLGAGGIGGMGGESDTEARILSQPEFDTLLSTTLQGSREAQLEKLKSTLKIPLSREQLHRVIRELRGLNFDSCDLFWQLGKVATDEDFEGDADLFVEVIAELEGRPHHKVQAWAIMAHAPNFNGNFHRLMDLVLSADTPPYWQFEAFSHIASHPNFKGDFSKLRSRWWALWVEHRDFHWDTANMDHSPESFIGANPNYAGDLLQLRRVIETQYVDRDFPRRLHVARLGLNPRFAPHLKQALEELKEDMFEEDAAGLVRQMMLRPGLSVDFWYLLDLYVSSPSCNIFKRHWRDLGNDPRFVDFLPFLNEVEKESAGDSFCLELTARIFAQLAGELMSAEGSEAEYKREALLDAILGAFDHPNPKVRKDFIRMTPVVYYDPALPVEIRAIYLNRTLDQLKDPDRLIRKAAQRALDQIQEEDRSKKPTAG